MPERPLTVCRYPGCRELTRAPGGYCPRHATLARQRKQEQQRQWSRDRGKTAERGYDGAWQRLREWQLKSHPLCADCAERGYVTAATVVHHLRPVEERPDLRLDPANLRSLCRDCHELRHGRGHRDPLGGQKVGRSTSP